MTCLKSTSKPEILKSVSPSDLVPEPAGQTAALSQGDAAAAAPDSGGGGGGGGWSWIGPAAGRVGLSIQTIKMKMKISLASSSCVQ